MSGFNTHPRDPAKAVLSLTPLTVRKEVCMKYIVIAFGHQPKTVVRVGVLIEISILPM